MILYYNFHAKLFSLNNYIFFETRRIRLLALTIWSNHLIKHKVRNIPYFISLRCQPGPRSLPYYQILLPDFNVLPLFSIGKVLYPSNQSESASRRKNAGFLSTTKRFSKPRDFMTKKTDLGNPGPGKYESKTTTAPGGTIVSKDTRFRQMKSEVPGPGAYEVSLDFNCL